MVRRTAVLAAVLFALLSLLAAAAPPPPAAPAPTLSQFLASLQPAPTLAVPELSPLAGALPAAGCGCIAEHKACCLSCSGNNFCTGNPGCQADCSDQLQQCQCACLHTC